MTQLYECDRCKRAEEYVGNEDEFTFIDANGEEQVGVLCSACMADLISQGLIRDCVLCGQPFDPHVREGDLCGICARPFEKDD